MFKFSDIPDKYKENYQKLIEDKKEDIFKRKTAVISFYHNRLIWTRCCLPTLEPEYALGKITPNYQVYLINNASEDGTADYFNRFNEFRYMFVHQIRHNENKGKPWAFNHALDTLPEDLDYIVSVDGDVEMPEFWLRDMIICFEELERQKIRVGELACDYQLLPGCRKTVNPNTLYQPQKCKILKEGIILDTTPDVAGGCLIWKADFIRAIGGYQLITAPSGKHNLYGMDDGLINLDIKRKSLLACYLVNVKAKHWGDYDEAIWPKYQQWKRTNINPVSQVKIKPNEIGLEYTWKRNNHYTDLKDVEKILMKYLNREELQVLEMMYRKNAQKLV